MMIYSHGSVKENIGSYDFVVMCEEDGQPYNVPLSPKVRGYVLDSVNKFKS